jgi:hypothetical protein
MLLVVGSSTLAAGTSGSSAFPTHQRRNVERTICAALTAGIAFQIVQRFTYTGYALSEYGRSLWYVTYRFGFVRRGLAGELLRSAFGGRPTIAEVDLVQNVVAVAMLGSAIALVVVLCKRRSLAAYAAAAALVIAPFGFDSVGGQRRPDLLGFLLLAVVGLWAATRPVNPRRLAIVAGSLLALCALCSEAAPLIVGPWLVLVVVAAERKAGATRSTWPSMLLTAVPSMIALTVLATAGKGDATTVSALEDAAPSIIRGHGSVFAYLGDSVTVSLRRVVERPNPELSLVVGALLAALLVFCGRGMIPYLRALGAWLLPTTRARKVWAAATALCTLLLFALGFDWLRWIATIGFAALLAGAAIVAIDTQTTGDGDDRERALWHRPVPSHVALSTPGILTAAAATYLLVLPPLPNFVNDLVVGARLLLGIPQ